MDNDMYSLRVLSHGEITDLSEDFSLKGRPFSIFVRPKKLQSSLETSILLECKCICDKHSSNLPVPVGDWTPAAIVSIKKEAIDLSEFSVFWGAGEIIKN